MHAFRIARCANFARLRSCTGSQAGLDFTPSSTFAVMVSTSTVEKVAAKPAFPISVDNISPNLVEAQYAGEPKT